MIYRIVSDDSMNILYGQYKGKRVNNTVGAPKCNLLKLRLCTVYSCLQMIVNTY